MAAKQPQNSAMGEMLDLRNLSPQQLEKIRVQVNNEIQTLTSAIDNYARFENLCFLSQKLGYNFILKLTTIKKSARNFF